MSQTRPLLMTVPLTNAEWKEALSLCAALIHGYQNSSDVTEELVERSGEFIMKAVKTYNPDKGTSFKTWLNNVISFETRKYLTHNGGWKRDRLCGMVCLPTAKDGLFDSGVTTDETVLEHKEDEHVFPIFKQLKIEVMQKIVSSLPQPIAGVVCSYYYSNKSLEEVGKQFGYHEQWVTRLLGKGKKIIKQRLESYNSSMPLPELQIHGSML